MLITLKFKTRELVEHKEARIKVTIYRKREDSGNYRAVSFTLIPR